MAKRDENVFLPRQFENEYHVEAHEYTTGKEIWMQLQSVDIKPDAFVAGVGTGGTIMGVCNYLKQQDPFIKVHPLEPKESPMLTNGKGTEVHRIQGIADTFLPSIVQLNKLDEVVAASDGDAILMAQKVARQLGLAVGISSGANLIGAIEVQDQLGDDAVVVTVLTDCNKKYLSTDLVNAEPLKEGYISSDVEFIDYWPVRR